MILNLWIIGFSNGKTSGKPSDWQDFLVRISKQEIYIYIYIQNRSLQDELHSRDHGNKYALDSWTTVSLWNWKGWTPQKVVQSSSSVFSFYFSQIWRLAELLQPPRKRSDGGWHLSLMPWHSFMIAVVLRQRLRGNSLHHILWLWCTHDELQLLNVSSFKSEGICRVHSHGLSECLAIHFLQHMLHWIILKMGISKMRVFSLTTRICR